MSLPAPNLPASRVVKFGVYEADLLAGELRKNGSRVKLEGQPFQILALLLQRPGALVSREELKQQLWPTDTFVDFEHSINVAVKRLRDALDDSAETPRYIETLPRRGYRFIYPINGDAAAAAPGAVPAGTRWKSSPLGIALSVLLVGAAAFSLVELRDRIFGPKLAPVDSVAVLPCKNFTGDPEQEFLADGVTDVLTTHLAQSSALVVPSVTSAMFFKGQRKKLPEIARELKVRAVVEPSVERSGDHLLMNFQLVHAADRHLWAKTYEVDARHIQTLLPNVARDILAALKAPVTSEAASRRANSHETTPEAYEAYLRARAYLRPGTAHGRARAEEFFKKAIESDPSFPEAYSGLARLYAHGGAYLAGGDLAARAKTREYAKKALDLDSSNAEAYTALAFADLADWDWAGTEQNFKRAIELDPNFVTARIWYAQFLGAMRRFDEALVQADYARRLAPLEVSTLSHAAVPYWQSGKIDQAQIHFQEIVDLDPSYWFGHHLLALTHLQKGRFQEAIASLQKSITLREASPNSAGSPFGESRNVGVLAYAFAKAGQRAEALKIVGDLERQEKEGKIRAATVLAIAHVGLGNRERALDWLETGYERHGAALYAINADPFFEPLHSHPRFQELIRRIGLVQGDSPSAPPAVQTSGSSKNKGREAQRAKSSK